MFNLENNISGVVLQAAHPKLAESSREGGPGGEKQAKVLVLCLEGGD